MMQRLSLLFVIVAAAPAWAQTPAGEPPPAAASDDQILQQAKIHFEAGRGAYNAGDFQTAVREFKAAEALRSSPILNYNIALANEKLNKRRVALKYYRRYLEQLPSAPNRAEVEGKIAALEKDIAASPGAGAPPPPIEQPAEGPPTAQQGQYTSNDPYAGQQPTNIPPPQKKKSYWWISLIIVGGVVVIVAIAVGAYFALGSAYYYSSTTPEVPRSAYLPNTAQYNLGRAFAAPEMPITIRF